MLEDYVFCGPSMVFTNIISPRSKFPKNDSKFYKRTRVKYCASIGANATVLCGLTIGEYAMIGAGSVILKDVPDFALVVGNPGKLIGWVDIEGNRIQFKNDGTSKCGKYRMLSEKKVVLTGKI